MLGHFWRLQGDSEPAIRANTTICFGKLASYMSVEDRERVVIPAFIRILKDPYHRSRMASLLAIQGTCLTKKRKKHCALVLSRSHPCTIATVDLFSASDLANRLLPGVSCMTIDPNRYTYQYVVARYSILQSVVFAEMCETLRLIVSRH